MHQSQISFRSIVPDIDSIPVDERTPIDIIEIKFPDGKVSAFPATDVNMESGRKYSDLYSRKYQAFKDGEPDPDRVKELEREIAERQAELDGLVKPKDDERVQENLGYGEKDESFKLKGRSLDSTSDGPHSTDYEPARIDQPVILGPDPTVKPVEPAKVPA